MGKTRFCLDEHHQCPDLQTLQTISKEERYLVVSAKHYKSHVKLYIADEKRYTPRASNTRLNTTCFSIPGSF